MLGISILQPPQFLSWTGTKIGKIPSFLSALYLDKILKDKNVLVTRLAHGLPMGASLDYADELTLIKALDNRKKIDSE